MKTNVKPGDRAMIIRATDARNLWTICRVVEPYEPLTCLPGQDWCYEPDNPEDVVWVVEALTKPLFVNSNQVQIRAVVDRCLMRLPEDDEVLKADGGRQFIDMPVLEEVQ